MRSYYRKKLNSLLEVADDEGFVQLIWAANILQTDDPKPAFPYLKKETFSNEHITTHMPDKTSIYKWELETLANELMTVPKRTIPKRGSERSLIINNYENIIKAVNYIRRLENVEYRQKPRSNKILVEVSRIANRQIDWQRGYFNMPQFYRNAFVYGQGACADYFQEKHGLSVDQFFLIGFGLYTSFIGHPVFNRNADFIQIGVGKGELANALSMVAKPFSEAKTEARSIRSRIYQTAYRPSVLRQSPCITFGSNNERVRAPLPQLILERVTSGIFYDIIDGGGAIRHDYGKRFEEYCLAYFKATLPSLEWIAETKYRVKPNQIDTPDILCRRNAELSLVIECKAARMSQGAKFGDDPFLARGYTDLVKAVYQIWRFFSHCRRGLCEFKAADESIGMVLTLDGWLVMAPALRPLVLEAARVMASENDPEILEVDRRTIVFVSVSDLESALTRATGESFLSSLIALAGPEYQGWMLSSVHERFVEPDQPTRNYPFTQDFSRIFPWWDMLSYQP